ncbi:hypothetical protein PISMIDRAFT_390466 [Pisolithus microcarpus 441]|uniref:DUF7721 domain-containing protein n=1 Tax=Pisolithus microcarpus 441 TaxID=765257 RepID=A0A0C9ZW31_9AGAM|nr:hypothetical protein PISMIDRAFT_390466 [Pisolithus microcarpus 441]
MDTFINLAKQGYEAYSQSQSAPQSNVDRTGGQDSNTPHHRRAENDGSGYDDNENRARYNRDNDSADFGRTGGDDYNTPRHRRAENDRPGFDDNENRAHYNRDNDAGGFRRTGGEDYNSAPYRRAQNDGPGCYNRDDGAADFRRTGGEEYNTPHHRRAQNDRPQFDDDEVVQHASRHSGSDNSSLFSSALNHIRGRQDEHEEPVDEESVLRAHDAAYNKGSASGLSAGSLGSAAALQALKSFSGGGGGGSSQNQLISLAMGEASKLFDQSGGASSGSKQDAINGAAMTAMKYLVQSKVSGAIGGGDSGGLGSLMSVVSCFEDCAWHVANWQQASKFM